MTVTVAAASDLRPILDGLLPAFERDNDLQVEVSYGSSGQLAKQIAEGAPFDVFFSADRAKALAAGGPEATLVPYAIGQLVLWVPVAGVTPQLTDLTESRFAHIAIANPDHAPYGVAARQSLESAGLWDDVKSRLVLGESATDTMRLATSGNADAAFVPRSLAVAAPAGSGSWTDIDPTTHDTLEQTAVVLASGPAADGASRLLDLLLSKTGRAALVAGGLDVPPAP